MTFYVSLLADSEIQEVERHGAGESGAEGAIKRAFFRVARQDFHGIDSPVKHAFGFTPSISIFVVGDNESELRETYAKLSDGGTVLMPLDDYGFSS